MATKVLVFESDPAFAAELRNELGKLGCSIAVVDDGNYGLQQAAMERPDLILLAIELPRMNGFSVCNKLKKDPGLKDVPLIIMSTESSDETFEQHKKLRTRAEDYVHKPIAFGELLRHILEFVPLSASASSAAIDDSDGAIVIDDEIEIGGLDYLADDGVFDVSGEGAASLPTSRRIEAVDADVDAFAESAFGRLTGSEAPAAHEAGAGAGGLYAGGRAHVDTGADVRAPANGAMTTDPGSSVVSFASTASVAPRPQSVRPPTFAGVDPAEHERVREELARTKARFDEVDRAFEETRAELERVGGEVAESERRGREIEELKAKIASGSKGAAASSREFLDLREALNRKDKEILTLKEQLAKKDRQIVETQDRSLAAERIGADLDERMLSMERELGETREKNESLAADRDLAKKASEDFRTRLEKARAENEAKERQFTELRSRHADDLAAAEGRFAAMRADLDQTLANERAEHARALDQSEEKRKKELDQERRDHEAQLAGARNEWQAELARTRGEGERREQAKLDELRAALEGKAASDVAAVEAKSAAELAAIQGKAATDVAAIQGKAAADRSALEAKSGAELAALEAKAASEIGEARETIARLGHELGAARAEGDTLRLTKGDLEGKVAVGESHIASLEAEAASLRQEVAEVRQRLGVEGARAEKAHAKWQADRQSLERAKDALAVALAQIEEAEARQLE
jgi:CheY-like chemotaxis protein